MPLKNSSLPRSYGVTFIPKLLLSRGDTAAVEQLLSQQTKPFQPHNGFCEEFGAEGAAETALTAF